MVHVGPGRAGHVLRFALRSEEFATAEAVAGARGEAIRSKADEALRLVAAWAVHHGMTKGFGDAMHAARQAGTPPSVVAAADFLETMDLTSIALSPEERSFDHLKAAENLLATFEGRDLAILERVLAADLRPVPTLQEIGDQFNITRERVRQLQVTIEERLQGLLGTDTYDVLGARAEALAAQVGVACPAAHLPAELQPGASLSDELFAYLAGPYKLADGWLLRRDVGTSPADLARSAFDTAADANGIAASDAVFDALSSIGVAPRWHLPLLQKADGIRLLDGH